MYVCGWNQAWILTWKLALNGQNAQDYFVVPIFYDFILVSKERKLH